jgi:hypothetical protein
MKNVAFKVDGDVLTITVKLKERHGPSGSGKTEIVATTGGNADIGHDGIKFGLSVFVKAKAKA